MEARRRQLEAELGQKGIRGVEFRHRGGVLAFLCSFLVTSLWFSFSLNQMVVVIVFVDFIGSRTVIDHIQREDLSESPS